MVLQSGGLMVRAAILCLTCAGLSHGYHASVDSFFLSSDPFIQQVCIPNIEKYRKSDVVVKFQDANGSPITGLQVQANMIKHKFLFGALIPTSQTDPNNALWLDVFNYGNPENAGKWDALERSRDNWDFSRLDAMLAWCEQNGVVFEEHFLSGYIPSWAQNASDLATRQLMHMKKVVDRYGARIPFYQVDNEATLKNHSHWETMKSSYPNLANRFGINNSINGGGWEAGGDGDGEEVIPSFAKVNAYWPGIAYIANQAHPGGRWWGPKDLYDGMFTKYENAPIKVHVTEFDAAQGNQMSGYRTGTLTEDLKAVYYVQVYATCFSAPSCEAISSWATMNYTGWSGNVGFAQNGTPVAAYNGIKSLIKDKLWTRTSGTSNAQGQFSFRGIHGKYEVVATGSGGVSIRDTFDLGPSQVPVMITITPDGVSVTEKKPMRPAIGMTSGQTLASYNIRGQRLAAAVLRGRQAYGVFIVRTYDSKIRLNY